MKKKFLIALAVLAINVIAFSTAKSARVAAPADWHWITIEACNCQTHRLEVGGECDAGICYDGTYWACTDNIPCGGCLN